MKPATWRSLVVYAIEFVASFLSLVVGRIGYCYTTKPLHIALSLSNRNLQGKRLPFATPSIHTKPLTMRFFVCFSA